ncbi:MAG: type II secretion system protein N [Gammaproteobacteria bacterium]
MISQSNKNLILEIINWTIIGLIVLLWIKFALFKDDKSNLQTNGVQVANSSFQSFSQLNDPIAKYHVFGSTEVLYDVPIAQNQTSLNWTLNGTMSGGEGNQGVAYISNSQGIQQKFNIGDKVFDVATLEEVHKSYVSFRHNGKLERLSLSENTNSTSSSSGSATKSLIQNKPATPSYMKHLNGAQQRNWQEMLDQQKFDPNKISSVVGNINLVTNQAGQIQGLRVSNLADGNLLKKHGLQSNDIITAINGNRISGSNLTTIRQTLQQNPNATITFKRNGKVQNIQVNISDL